MVGLLALVLLALSGIVLSASTPPSGAITVGPSSTGAKYATLAAALKDTSSSTYFIYSGTYTGQTLISRANVVVYGQSNNSAAYSSNTVTLTDNVPASTAGSNDASGTLRISATGVKLYNLNIVNTYGKPVEQSQAIALSVEAGTFACYACQIKGTQDTLLADKGTQFYGKCYIEGLVDFIFGQQASIWITGSTISTTGQGYITASGRSSADANYYVIDHSTIQGTGPTYLGRPWRDYARVVYQYSTLGSNIQAAGWSIWSSATPNTDNVLFGEFNNTGAGAWNSARASFATKLSAPISITTVLGSTSWIDQSFIGTSITTPASSTTPPASTSVPPASSTVPPASTTTAPAGATVAKYGQCGGIGYTGATVCAAGSTCTYSNAYYSQCL